MTWKRWSVLAAVVCFVAAMGCVVSAGAAIVDVDFDNATLSAGPPPTITDNDTGSVLTDFSSINNPALSAGNGVGSPASTGLYYSSNGAMVSDVRTIDDRIEFSLFAKYTNEFTNFTSAGGLSFGWTQAAGEYNPYSGTEAGVASTDHVLVGLAKASATEYRLSAANGAHSGFGTGNFGTSAQTLTLGNWYRLSGGVFYDSTSKVFTFGSIKLDDMGPNGISTPTTVLFGSRTVSAPTFGTTGRVVYGTNRDRGFVYTDNYYAAAIPEPSTITMLTALGVMMGLAAAWRRRRRSKSA